MMVKDHTQDFLEMYDSLQEAIIEAGGSPTSYLSKNLKSMTVTELITRLATNKIRFFYDGDKKPAPKINPKKNTFQRGVQLNVERTSEGEDDE